MDSGLLTIQCQAHLVAAIIIVNVLMLAVLAISIVITGVSFFTEPLRINYE